jgi:ribosome-binding protein aMBF1 (putative translation factor)
LQNSYWRKKIREYVVNTKLDYKKKTNPNRYDERKRFGKMIARIREEKGMSQEELAEKTGYTLRNIGSIEVGKYSVTFDVLSKIADALGKKIELL